MRLKDLYLSSFEGLKRNIMRSILTTLGVIIGVGSVVLMVSLGVSFQRYILDQVEQFGGNLIDIYPTGLEEIGQVTDTLTYADYEALSKLSTIQSVAPVIFVTEPVQYGREQALPLIFGTTPSLLQNYSVTIANGRTLDERDILSAKNVAVVSYQTAIDLFDSINPLGQKITIGNRSFTVVGVTESVGSLLAQDLDTPVYIPFTVAQSMTGKSYIDYVSAKATAADELARADITSLLRQRHRIDNPEDDPGKDDFRARSAEQATEIIGTVTEGITVFLALIAAISLLVGGIGIMNIMLVSVSERTKEIGLRKAVGATRRDILLQFLFEAIALTLTGGVIGILGGMGLGYLIALVADQALGQFSFFISWLALTAALFMAIATGIVFGLYPARKAAALSPTEAMRWE